MRSTLPSASQAHAPPGAGVSRSTRQQQIVFLNGRPIENQTVSHALREGYHTALMKGQILV